MNTKYLVRKSVAHVGDDDIGEYDYFEDAVAAARRAGAKGEPIDRGMSSWCFDGGRESVGYWILEIRDLT